MGEWVGGSAGGWVLCGPGWASWCWVGEWVGEWVGWWVSSNMSVVQIMENSEETAIGKCREF